MPGRVTSTRPSNARCSRPRARTPPRPRKAATGGAAVRGFARNRPVRATLCRRIPAFAGTGFATRAGGAPALRSGAVKKIGAPARSPADIGLRRAWTRTDITSNPILASHRLAKICLSTANSGFVIHSPRQNWQDLGWRKCHKGFRGEQMIDLGSVKKCLSVSPRLYRNVYNIYRATPFSRNRKRLFHARLASRLESEACLVKKYLNDDWTVRHGPFAGMKYAAMSSSASLSLPKVIGSYESPIHSWIMDAIKQDYDRILNVGCGEGYYAVGFSLKSPSSQIYAYDIDDDAQEYTAKLARLNNISDKVSIRTLCTIDAMRQQITDNTLIFCDIEGGELDLFRPDLAPELSQTDLIIELHDFCRPRATEVLLRRFHHSHRVEITYHCAKYAKDFPVLERIPIREQAFLLEECRVATQGWMRLLANRPGALQSEPDRWWRFE